MEEKLTNKERRRAVKNLFEKIEKNLKAEDNPRVDLLLIINDLQDIITEKYPFESSFIVSAIEKNIHLFEKSFFKKVFSVESVSDWLLDISNIYVGIEKQGLLNKETAIIFKDFFEIDDFERLAPFFKKICDTHSTIEIANWMKENKIIGLKSPNEETVLHFLAHIPPNETIASITKNLKENYLSLPLNADGKSAARYCHF